MPLTQRLQPFLERGLIEGVPSRFQILQGELQMWPTVLSTDVTDEARYAGAPLGHPVLRQPVIFAMIGLDHLRIGTGLGAAVGSTVSHLHFTFHAGMPVWDLQVLQTHPDGLARLRAGTEALLARHAPADRHRMRWLARVLPHPEGYLRSFLGPEGYIARAERFDYPTAREEAPALDEAFFSVTGFMNHCLGLPEHPRQLGVRLPVHLLALATERFREGKRLGWSRVPLRTPAP